MRARGIITIGPVALLALTASAFADVCDDDRYLCEPKAVAEPQALPPGNASPHPVAARSPIRRTEKKATARIMPARLSDNEKAPPDLPRQMAISKAASSWTPIDVPSHAVQPPEKSEATGMDETVSVVSAEDVNEIDLAVLSIPDPVKIVPIRVVWPAPPEAAPVIQVASPPPPPVDTSLLERVFVTFGGAFGAASALRMFIG